MNKLIRKITLSGVTLGVAALSVTTSTFAWFTTNSEASASNVSGKVDSSGNNMLIKTIKAWDGQSYSDNSTETTASSDVWGGFASTVDLTPKSEVKLKPVTYVKNESSNQVSTAAQTDGASTSGGTSEAASTTSKDGFYTAKTGTNSDFTEAAAEKDYLHYQVIFGLSGLATGSDITNKVTLTVYNFTSTNSGSQYLLVDAGDNAKAGSTVTVNLLDVLSMRVESTIIDSSNTKLSTYGLSNSDVPSGNGYKITSNDYSYRYRAESDNATKDALTYYQKVYGLDSTPTRPEDNARGYQTTSPTTLVSADVNSSEKANAITLFTITGNATAYVLCDIYFYIDGWDKECFNAVGGLSLDSGTLKFNLTTN